MAKALVKMKCDKPNCDHPHDMEVDLPEPKTIQGEITPIPVYQPPIPPQSINYQPPKEEKKITHEELAEMIPTGINAMACPGGDCGHMKLKNKKQTKKWKSCPNCEANTVPKGSEFCPYCTKNLDPKDLEDGIELEEEDEEEDEDE